MDNMFFFTKIVNVWERAKLAYNNYHHIFTKFRIRNSVYFIRTGQFEELCKLYKYYIRGWHNNYQ